MPSDDVDLPHAMAKAAVIAAFERSGCSRIEMAHRMGLSAYQVSRILDPSQGTKLNTLHDFAVALGGRLSVVFITGEPEDDTRV